jgi:hypothetical protein
MLFEPLPTPGSSGGPIIDEETGAVVGVMLGTRMDNQVEGLRGWGVPAEMIYEVSLLDFCTPSLDLQAPDRCSACLGSKLGNNKMIQSRF